MNLQDIKQSWDNQPEELPEIETLPKKIEKAKQPLRALRQNIRREFYIQVIALLATGFLPYWFSLEPDFLIFFYMLYAIMVAITIHYFLKFYRFYKVVDDYSLTTGQNLLKLYYEIKLHLEMYKSLTYILFPFALMLLIVIQKDAFYASWLHQDAPRQGFIKLIIPFSIGVSVLAVIGFTNAWVNSYYGKYVEQVKKILDDLEP